MLVAVVVVMETNDKRLRPSTIDVSTAAKAAALRRAVLENLPKVTRVVAVMPEPLARMMMTAHDQAMTMTGVGNVRPPADYVPPTND